MQVSVTYNEPPQQIWLRIEVPEACTVAEAIERSGILASFPHIDLESQKVGIFGKVSTLDVALRTGDRVEIYRAITCDPATVPRRMGEDSED
jgi:putative ubiquitin-RnfH superfamily antitoxin RatB of RatAB toxin-antitoxin module